MLLANFSVLHYENRVRDWNCKPRSKLWFLLRILGKRQGPISRFKLLLPEDGLTLWRKLSFLLFFREVSYIIMSSSILKLIVRKRQACALDHCHHILFFPQHPHPFEERIYYWYKWRLPFFLLFGEDSFVCGPCNPYEFLFTVATISVVCIVFSSTLLSIRWSWPLESGTAL